MCLHLLGLQVVPANLLQQWADEIERHVKPGVLTWCHYLPPSSTEEEAAEAARRRPQRSAARRGEGTRRSTEASAGAGSSRQIFAKPGAVQHGVHPLMSSRCMVVG